jgi:Flp pilus assembly secretin CpaC
MKSIRLFALLSGVCLGLLPLVGIAQENASAVTLRLQVGEGEFIEGEANRIVVSNEAILKAEVRNDRRGVNVVANRSGTSDLTIIGPDGKETKYVIFVRGASLDEDFEELRQLVTESELFGISISKTQRSLIAKGTIYTSKELRLWQAIKERFDLNDLVVVEIRSTEFSKLLEEYKQQVSRLISPNEILRVELIGLANDSANPTLKLSGLLLSEESKTQVEQLGTHYFERILNQIEVQKPIIEINTSLVTVDFSKTDSRGDNELFSQIAQVNVEGSAFTELSFTDALGASASPTGSNLGLRILPEGANARIKARRSNDLVVSVKDSAVAVKSGEKAGLTEGGNIFFQQSTDDAVGLTAVEIGLRVNVTPTVIKSGEIDMLLDISNISAQPSSVGTGQVETRESKTQTTVKIRPQETIVLSGVDSSTSTESTSGTPLLEKIPVVNIFFKKKEKVSSNQRTYFLITPSYATIREEGLKNLSGSAFDMRRYADDKAQFQKTGLGFWLGYEPDFKNKPDEKASPYGTLKRQ